MIDWLDHMIPLKYHEAISLIERLREAAEASHSNAQRVKALAVIGRTHAAFKMNKNAISDWEEMLPLISDINSKSWLFHELGRCHLKLGMVQPLLSLALSALTLVPKTSIPTIKTAMLASIPTIETALLASIHTIDTALLASILTIETALLASIPTVETALLASIPTIETALLASILTIETALLASIPTLEIALLASIPTIETALLASIPTIETALLASILTIETALLASIPTLETALLTSIPTIETALLANIPTIETALLAKNQSFSKMELKLITKAQVYGSRCLASSKMSDDAKLAMHARTLMAEVELSHGENNKALIYLDAARCYATSPQDLEYINKFQDAILQEPRNKTLDVSFRPSGNRKTSHLASTVISKASAKITKSTVVFQVGVDTAASFARSIHGQSLIYDKSSEEIERDPKENIITEKVNNRVSCCQISSLTVMSEGGVMGKKELLTGFGKRTPHINCITRWVTQFESIGFLCARKRKGRPWTSNETVDGIQAVLHKESKEINNTD
uniref:Uncharacterized protein n=1 Tax=Timema bartmani TaxID=61472 RepID=A0A7R9HXQ8_9NEOP|nr:unnamed protein product [Timema bartmani]